MMHMSTEGRLPGGGRGFGYGPQFPVGFVTAAVAMGLGEVQRHSQPDRLQVVPVPQPLASPATQRVLRLMHPNSMDAGRLLDYGAPAPMRLMEAGVFPFRRTEAPQQFQRQVALGGRQVLVL